MKIPQYSAPNAPFTEKDGRLTFAGNVFLRDLWLRVGGANGLSNTELLELIEALQAADILLAAAIAAKQTAIQFRDEGVSIGALGGITSLDIVGAGATLTAIGSDATLTIPGGGGGGSLDDILMVECLL